MKKTLILLLLAIATNSYAMSYEDSLDDISMDSLTIQPSVADMMKKVSKRVDIRASSLKQISKTMNKPKAKTLQWNEMMIAKAVRQPQASAFFK